MILAYGLTHSIPESPRLVVIDVRQLHFNPLALNPPSELDVLIFVDDILPFEVLNQLIILVLHLFLYGEGGDFIGDSSEEHKHEPENDQVKQGELYREKARHQVDHDR